jgi:hypothetical protein
VAGAAAIRVVQTDIYTRGAPYPTPGSRFIVTSETAVEIKAKLPDESALRTASLFYINEAGRIQSLSWWKRDPG